MVELVQKRKGKGQSTYEIKGDLGDYSSGKAWAEATLVTKTGEPIYNRIYLGGPNRWFVKVPTGGLDFVRQYTTQTQYVDELGQPMSVDPSRLPENQGFSTKYQTVQSLPLKPEAVALAKEQYTPQPPSDPYSSLPPVVKQSAQATDYITGWTESPVTGKLLQAQSLLSPTVGFGPFTPKEFKTGAVRGALTAIPALPYATYSLVTKPLETGRAMWTQAIKNPIRFAGEFAGASVVLSKIPTPKLRTPTYKVTALTGIEESTSIFTRGKGLPITEEVTASSLEVGKGSLAKKTFSPVELKTGGKLDLLKEAGRTEEIKPFLETYKVKTKTPPTIPEFQMREVGTSFQSFKGVKEGGFISVDKASRYYQPFETGTPKTGTPITTTLKSPPALKELNKIYRDKGANRIPVLDEFKKPPASIIPEAPAKFPPEAPLSPSRMLGDSGGIRGGLEGGLEGGLKTRIKPEILTKPIKSLPLEIEEIPATLPRGMSVPVAAASLSKSIVKPRLGASSRLDFEPRLNQASRVNLGSMTVTREIQTLTPRVRPMSATDLKVSQDIASRLVTRPAVRSMSFPGPRSTGVRPPISRGPTLSSKRPSVKAPSALAPGRKPKKLRGGGGLGFYGKRTGLADVIFSSARGKKKVEAAGGFFERVRRRVKI